MPSILEPFHKKCPLQKIELCLMCNRNCIVFNWIILNMGMKNTKCTLRVYRVFSILVSIIENYFHNYISELQRWWKACKNFQLWCETKFYSMFGYNTILCSREFQPCGIWSVLGLSFERPWLFRRIVSHVQ